MRLDRKKWETIASINNNSNNKNNNALLKTSCEINKLKSVTNINGIIFFHQFNNNGEEIRFCFNNYNISHFLLRCLTFKAKILIDCLIVIKLNFKKIYKIFSFKA